MRLALFAFPADAVGSYLQIQARAAERLANPSIVVVTNGGSGAEPVSATEGAELARDKLPRSTAINCDAEGQTADKLTPNHSSDGSDGESVRLTIASSHIPQK